MSCGRDGAHEEGSEEILKRDAAPDHAVEGLPGHH